MKQKADIILSKDKNQENSVPAFSKMPLEVFKTEANGFVMLQWEVHHYECTGDVVSLQQTSVNLDTIRSPIDGMFREARMTEPKFMKVCKIDFALVGSKPQRQGRITKGKAITKGCYPVLQTELR